MQIEHSIGSFNYSLAPSRITKAKGHWRVFDRIIPLLCAILAFFHKIRPIPNLILHFYGI